MKEEPKKEYTLDDLEDIIREYSSQPLPDKAAPAEGDTVRMDPVKPPVKDKTGDTRPVPDPDPDADVRIYPGPKSRPAAPPPPQEPIPFPTSRAQELRKKLEGEPQRRYQELTRGDAGRLQAGILLNALLFLAAAGTTALCYRAEGTRLSLLVIGQLVALLLSAAVGYRLLLEGVTDILHRRFRLGSLLAVSFLVCLMDGIACIGSRRLPCGAAFCLQMLMAQWARLQRLQTQISRLDTLRRAEELTAVVKTRSFYQGKGA